MLQFTIFSILTLVLVLLFFSLKKSTHPLLLLFILMVSEFLFTTFISIIVDNGHRWKVTEELTHFIMFRLLEVIFIPFLLLLYIECINRGNSSRTTLLLSIVWTLICMLVEYGAIKLNIFHHERWEYWMSFIFWSSFLLILAIVHAIFSKQLRREGISI
ncbi:hypothetical protein FZW96_17315 [Bacillus sp. BGMRC 2118]|nr:hypothetical protein FZW96_17315 [Bacillus sp. BGMRC 2118]